MNRAGNKGIAGLHWHDDGRGALSGSLLRRAQQLDAVFAGWASEFGAAEHAFPSLIAASDLAPIGWLRSFPQLATLVVQPDRDPENLRRFAERFGSSDSIEVDAASLGDVSYLLTPATCYHIYPQFAERTLDEPTYISAICQCHRCEDSYRPLQRQWSFQMRELVCLGDADATAALCADMQPRIARFAAAIGINGNWQTASDPFFDPAGDPKALAQLVEPSKLEFCTPSGLALASINEHRSFFGECYGIDYGAQPAVSACVAFGIERWLHALADAHGPAPDVWPQPEPTQ